ncbi:hypothetical protein [Streptococcus dysgalactiae]|uniref:hypothetical protein n=1 Tax=Streptococcus dysgalactiae TaxID=1334 RepID=UPI001FA94E14|nr:hypothetical protein [Streptococcus dysgalactiae]
MVENPVVGIVVLLFISFIAYLGNRNSNQKMIEKTVETILDEHIVIKQVKTANKRKDFIELPTPGSCGKEWGKAPW